MSGEEQVVDATVVFEEDKHERELGQALERRESVTLSVTPQIKAGELVERLAVIRDAMENSMVEGVDYGVIPGTAKPTLLKPGAEKLGVLFQLDVQLVNEKTWGPGDHLTVTSKATAYHAPTSTRVGYGEGICTTRERKYAYRLQQRTCPTCSVAAIIKGKAEFGGGWICFKKKGGCGAKFPDGASEIEGQTVGEIDNPDLPDLWNTVDKMGEKRARVDVILAVTGASALFSQDQDDEVGVQVAGPLYGPAVSDAQLAIARKAIAYLLRVETDDVLVDEACAWLSTDTGGYLPACTMRGLTHVAKRVKERDPEEIPSAEVRDAELLAAESDSIASEVFGESVEQ